MSPYCQLQEQEFASEEHFGFAAEKHLHFLCTGYFDALQQIVAGGISSAIALKGSAEAERVPG
jgi:isocitrate lyase